MRLRIELWLRFWGRRAAWLAVHVLWGAGSALQRLGAWVWGRGSTLADRLNGRPDDFLARCRAHMEWAPGQATPQSDLMQREVERLHQVAVLEPGEIPLSFEASVPAMGELTDVECIGFETVEGEDGEVSWRFHMKGRKAPPPVQPGAAATVGGGAAAGPGMEATGA